MCLFFRIYWALFLKRIYFASPKNLTLILRSLTDMKSFKLTLSTLFAVLCTIPSLAQESLQAKYDNMLENTETWEQYKMIPRTTLNGFWSEVSDTLRANKAQIVTLKEQVIAEKAATLAASADAAQVQDKLDESLNLNDSISFLGISFSKVGYHLLVWSIIVILAALGAISYFMFMRSNRVTVRVKNEYDTLNDEFEEQKNKARESQAKLKRELQTALNALNERR